MGQPPAACIGHPCFAAVLSPAGRAPIIGHAAPAGEALCICAHIGQDMAWFAPALSCAIGIAMAIPGIADIPPTCIGHWAAIGAGATGSGAVRAHPARRARVARKVERIGMSAVRGHPQPVPARVRF